MAEFLLQFPGHEPLRMGPDRPVVTVGRTADNTIALKDAAISRQHARLELNGNRLVLEDLASRHGCQVNGRQVRLPRAIVPGDRIFLGPVPLVLVQVEAGAEAEEPTPPVSRPLAELRSWQAEGGRLREVVETLRSFGLRALGTAAPEVLLRDLVARLKGHLEADGGAVLLPRDGDWGSLSGHGYSLETLRAIFERREAQLMTRPPRLLVPLEFEGEVLGLFRFSRTRNRRPFDEHDLGLAVAMGNLGAATLVRQRLEDEVQRRRRLEARQGEEAAALQARQDLLVQASRQVAAPMNALLGFTALALEQDLPAPARDCMEKVQHAGLALVSALQEALARAPGGGGDSAFASQRPEDVARSQEPTAGASSLVGARILVVAGQALDRDLLERLLTREGAEVQAVPGGREALAWASRERCDLVLLELDEAVGALAEALRELPGGAERPLVGLASLAVPSGREACRAAGLDDVLLMPLEPPRLLQVVGHWLSTAGPGCVAGAAVSSRGLVLDRLEALARVGGEEGLFRELLSVFLDRHQASATRIGELLDLGRRQDADREVHSLKGAASILGGQLLVAAAEALEQALASPGTTERALADLGEALDAFCEAARRLV